MLPLPPCAFEQTPRGAARCVCIFLESINRKRRRGNALSRPSGALGSAKCRVGSRLCSSERYWFSFFASRDNRVRRRTRNDAKSEAECAVAACQRPDVCVRHVWQLCKCCVEPTHTPGSPRLRKKGHCSLGCKRRRAPATTAAAAYGARYIPFGFTNAAGCCAFVSSVSLFPLRERR